MRTATEWAKRTIPSPSGLETSMKDLKFEQKRSLSRLEAADQLTALATMLRKGGHAELELGAATLSLRIPDDLRGEIEIEVGDGEIELEIEFKWPTAPGRAASPQAVSDTERAPSRKAAGGKVPGRKAAARKAAPAAKPAGRAGTGTGAVAPAGASGGKSTKRAATKAP
ncbi:amphi-Trp domain-containing protein [Streptomyces sp. NPDC058612]|uniref:amphi-Trp domain-containing protein n=1 Tax=Streptomyces sp. NPDC058612 TaxID=3346555 RepID=UPI003657238C